MKIKMKIKIELHTYRYITKITKRDTYFLFKVCPRCLLHRSCALQYHNNL